MICCSFMHSPDTNQCPEYLGSERGQGSKESPRKNRKLKTLRKCSAHQSKVMMVWKPVAAWQWWHCSMQIRDGNCDNTTNEPVTEEDDKQDGI